MRVFDIYDYLLDNLRFQTRQQVATPLVTGFLLRYHNKKMKTFMNTRVLVALIANHLSKRMYKIDIREGILYKPTIQPLSNNGV